ncbi:MAG: ORF6N domain-containing protein [Gammaproteobacteria bacterium]|nr:ORF6N domain-containing protein [Gammaproteobacteria bacterium]
MKNKITILEKQNIRDKIYTIRDKQVMLDRDLAELYQVKPIRLREQVKRNMNRFPRSFMFQLNDEEVDFMVSQFAIPSRQHLGGTFPYVFTEQGVAMLSAVLKNDTAVSVSIQIMETFVQMRRLIMNNAVLFRRMDRLEKQQLITKTKLEQVFQAIEDKKIKPEKGIFFEGQVFDAYVFVSKLIKQAQKSIVLVDNYIDESVLILLSKRSKNCVATVYTKAISQKLALDLKKHNEQYSPIEIKVFSQAHDRFLILDGCEIYHIGASLKDLGKKWFAFSKLDKLGLEFVKRLNQDK